MGRLSAHFRSLLNLNPVKVKGRYASQSELHFLKKIILTQKRHCKVSIIAAMKEMSQLAVFNIPHVNSNREHFFAFNFFFALNCRKDWWKFNSLTSASPISSSGTYQNYVIVWIEVSNPSSKTPSLFIAEPPSNCPKIPVLDNFPYILFCCDP